MIEPMYFEVFFDVDKPKDDRFAMKMRITYYKYLNLIDGMIPNKEVDLSIGKCRIISYIKFSIINTVDNHHFVICDVEKIK